MIFNILGIEINFPDEIIKGPFSSCSNCKKSELGVLEVLNNVLTKKCKSCGWWKSDPLPKIKKKSIYLDQFVVSNFSKIDENRKKGISVPENIRQFSSILDLLKELVVSQEVICPSSLAHDEESAFLSDEYDPFFRMLAVLSSGIGVLSSYEIQMHQLKAFAESFSARRSIRFWESINVFMADPNQWSSRMVVGDLVDSRNWIDDLKKEKQAISKELGPVFSRWRQEKGKQFGDWYKEEVTHLSRRFTSQFEKLILGATIESIGIENHYAFDMFSAFYGSLSDKSIEGLKKYLGVSFESLPYNKIHAAMYAELADRISNHGKKDPPSSHLNDIDIISAYIPYVDAIVIDNDMRSILNSKNVLPFRSEFPCKIFSSSNFEEMRAWLQDLHRNIDPEKTSISKEIY